jgi:hypothetical protein
MNSYRSSKIYNVCKDLNAVKEQLCFKIITIVGLCYYVVNMNNMYEYSIVTLVPKSIVLAKSSML